MDKELAEETIRDLLSCSGKLDQSVAILEGAIDDELFIRYRQLVGEIMGLLYIEILRNLFTQYPDLEPASMK